MLAGWILAGAVAGCADQDAAVPTAAPVLTVRVAAVEAQPCDRPRPRRGVATLVADDVVLTAAHVVEGPLRRLTIDGREARVVATNASLDLALVRLGPDRPSGSDDPIAWFHDLLAEPETPFDAVIRRPGGDLTATATRTLLLRVDDLTDGVVHERPAVELAVVVDGGDSGAPVLDPIGRVTAVVVLRRASAGVSYASVLPDLDELAAMKALAGSGGCA